MPNAGKLPCGEELSDTQDNSSNPSNSLISTRHKVCPGFEEYYECPMCGHEPGFATKSCVKCNGICVTKVLRLRVFRVSKVTNALWAIERSHNDDDGKRSC
jgi:hypothetical protein